MQVIGRTSGWSRAAVDRIAGGCLWVGHVAGGEHACALAAQRLAPRDAGDPAGPRRGRPHPLPPPLAGWRAAVAWSLDAAGDRWVRPGAPLLDDRGRPRHLGAARPWSARCDCFAPTAGAREDREHRGGRGARAGAEEEPTASVLLPCWGALPEERWTHPEGEIDAAGVRAILATHPPRFGWDPA